MRKILALYGTAMFVVLGSVPALAQSAPGQTVNVTPNQQTTTASATSNPSGQNISQQNNFSDPGTNAFGPGIQCGGPYLASSAYRNDSSNPGSIGVGGYSDVGGTIGLVVPLNGSNKKCQEFVNEIVFQRQIDTCLAMLKQGFEFDPNGQYASLAKRCSGIHYTGQPISTANPVSPAPPPTVITVPAGPQGTGTPLLRMPGSVRGQAPDAAPPANAAAATQPAAAAGQPATSPAQLSTSAAQPAAASTTQTIAAAKTQTSAASQIAVTRPMFYCQSLDGARKKRLMARLKAGIDRQETLDMLHAACVSDTEILAALSP